MGGMCFKANNSPDIPKDTKRNNNTTTNNDARKLQNQYKEPEKSLGLIYFELSLIL